MVCYFERLPGGSALRRVRLVGAAFDRSWTAPGASGEVVSGVAAGGGAAVAGIRAAAKWVAETLRSLGAPRLDVLVLDPEGGMCTWLSAPSPDPHMVGATVRQAVLGGSEGAGGSAARLVAAGIAAGEQASMEGDSSFQALAVAEPSAAGGGLLFRARAKGSGVGEQRERFGVISIRDAAARVFIDELDARSIEIGTVESTWHALGAALDPAAPRAGDEPAANPDTCAAVMIDPAGRIVWAWSRAGEVIAAGSIRLRHVTHRVAPAAPAGAIVPADRDLEEPAEISGLECTGADVSRLVMDWLAWSAQLGRAPDRIISIGPITIPAQPGPVPGAPWLGGHTPASLAEGLGRGWPGATIDAAVHEDPVGVVLSRIAGVGPVGALPDSARLVDDDPRRELVGLSSRPGRADRWMYRWMAAGLLAAAAAVIVVGWQFHQSAATARAGIQGLAAKRVDMLKEMDALVPAVSVSPVQVALGRLSGKAAELETINKSLRPQRPILREVERVLLAMEDTENVRLLEVSLNAAVGTVKLRVPDGESGPAILDRVTAVSYEGCIPWSGRTPPLIRDDDRQYVLTGSWPSDVRPGGRP